MQTEFRRTTTERMIIGNPKIFVSQLRAGDPGRLELYSCMTSSDGRMSEKTLYFMAKGDPDKQKIYVSPPSEANRDEEIFVENFIGELDIYPKVLFKKDVNIEEWMSQILSETESKDPFTHHEN